MHEATVREMIEILRKDSKAWDMLTEALIAHGFQVTAPAKAEAVKVQQ